MPAYSVLCAACSPSLRSVAVTRKRTRHTHTLASMRTHPHARNVQRVLASGPSAGSTIHEKNESTVANVLRLDGTIGVRGDTQSVGARNFKLFEAMQMVSSW